MDNSTISKIMKDTFTNCIQLRNLKGGEYSGDKDGLENFKRNATAIGLETETIWRVYAGKHWDAITQKCKDIQNGKHDRQVMEGIEGRIDDMITYLVLFKCLLRERNDTGLLSTSTKIPSDNEYNND